MEYGDGDAVGDVETGSADGIRLNAPFTDGSGFPSHVIEQQLRGDVLHLAGLHVHFNPCEFIRSDAVAVGIVEVREEINSEVRSQFKHGSRGSVGIIGRTLDAHRVKESMVDGHVDAHGMNGRTVIVRCCKHVGVIAGKVRRKGRRVTVERLKETRGIAHGWVVEGPIDDDGPLISFPVNGKDIGFQRLVSGEVKVCPRRNDIVHLKPQGLNFSLCHVDGDLRQGSLIPGFKNLRAGLHWVPSGWGAWR